MIKTIFFTGLNKLREITQVRKFELRIDLEDFERRKAYALYKFVKFLTTPYFFVTTLKKYRGFSIGDSPDYQLRFNNDSYTGNAGIYNFLFMFLMIYYRCLKMFYQTFFNMCKILYTIIQNNSFLYLNFYKLTKFWLSKILKSSTERFKDIRKKHASAYICIRYAKYNAFVNYINV